MNKVAIIAASNNNNLKLAKSFESELKSKGVASEIIDLVELDFPLYTPKREEEEGVPNEFQSVFNLLGEANAFVFLAPEYNGGVPPILTNMIAWASRAGKEWRECFNGKPAIVGTHSGGGGVNVLVAMRVQLSYIGLNVLGRQIHTNFNKPLANESLAAVVDELKKYI